MPPSPGVGQHGHDDVGTGGTTDVTSVSSRIDAKYWSLQPAETEACMQVGKRGGGFGVRVGAAAKYWPLQPDRKSVV